MAAKGARFQGLRSNACEVNVRAQRLPGRQRPGRLLVSCNSHQVQERALFIFGVGYTGIGIANHFASQGWCAPPPPSPAHLPSRRMHSQAAQEGLFAKRPWVRGAQGGGGDVPGGGAVPGAAGARD